MLQIAPKGWWSHAYTVSDDSGGLTEVNIRWSREAGSFELGHDTFEVGREGWMSGDFYLERRGSRLARADKPSALTRRFVVHVHGTKYELAAASIVSRKFELSRGGRCVGRIEPTSIFTRRAVADLPEELPLEVQIFLVWLVLVLWRRAQNSNSS